MEPGFRKAFLKAQVLCPKRDSGVFENGFEGGVHLVSDPDQAFGVADQMLGQRLLTHTVPEGVVCNTVTIVETVLFRKLWYLSILMDRNSQGPLLIGSALEHGAFFRPDAVFTEPIDVVDGLEMDQCERMAENLGMEIGTRAFDQAVTTMANLYSMFVDSDCTMIEVRPMGETHSGDIVVADARIQIDDRAAFRQEKLFSNHLDQQRDPREAIANREGIDYIGLDGSIGCMVNGAGLAMATMDLIRASGGAPSNFLDVGGGATQDQVQSALSLLEEDPSVKVILVNIFGGLVRCDVIANGILGVARAVGIRTPMVLRLQGTNYGDARALLEECQTTSHHHDYGDIRLVDDLEDAVALAVEIAAGIELGGDCHGHVGTPTATDVLDDDPLAIAGLVRDTGGAKEQGIPRFEGFSL